MCVFNMTFLFYAVRTIISANPIGVFYFINYGSCCFGSTPEYSSDIYTPSILMNSCIHACNAWKPRKLNPRIK